MSKSVEHWSGWHLLADGKSLRDGTPTRVGEIERIEGPLVLHRHGLHASARIVDALDYAPGHWLSRVELIGPRVDGDDRSCAMECKRITIINAERMLHEFALWCAHRALTAERAAGREPDPRSWEALRVKRLWLEDKATDEELRAAECAAACAAENAAACAAANAARRTAWSAARRAARDAVACRAARDAERAAQERWLRKAYARF